MKLEWEGKSPIDEVTEAQIRKIIRSLRSYGPISFASLTDDHGNYLQVAGGGVTCMLEQYEVDSGIRLRAHHDNPSSVFPDGTRLVFGGGEMPMLADEWFTAAQVENAFVAFLRGEPFPDYVRWRKAP